MDQHKDEIQQILNELMGPIDGKKEISFTQEGEQWRINVKTKSPRKLVGQGGTLVNSIQHVLRVIFHNRHPEDRTHFMIDVNSNRREREDWIIKNLPIIVQEDILTLGKTVVMVGLNGYERKIIHDQLAETNGVETTSVGDREERRLLLRPTSDMATTGLDNSRVIDINREIDLED